LRTRLRGDFRSRLPSFAPFDHAIAYVPSLGLFLDGTAEHTGPMELPRMDLGALGLFVGPEGTELRVLPNADPEKNFVRRSVTARLSPNGEARLELDYETSGFVSAEWRRRYHAQATLRARVSSDLGGEYPGFELAPGPRGLQTSNLGDALEPVRIRIAGSTKTFARREGDELSMAVTPSLRLPPKFASLSRRTQPVVTESFTTTEETVVVELPEGARVVSAPTSVEEKGRFGSYSVRVSVDGSRVEVKSRVAVTANRIAPRDYADWRRFCEAVDRAFSPRLLVRP